MKRVLVLLFFLNITLVKGQDILPITYGPLVSMTSTSLSTAPDLVDQVSGAGYNIGAMVRLKVLIFYAQGEVSWGTKSASITVTDTGANSNVTYKLNGMDLTTLFGMKLLGLGDLGNFRIFGGYNWNNFTDISYSVDGNNFSANDVNKNNHSFILGFGVDLLKLSFDLKFINGFVDLSESSGFDVESRVINLTLAYRFK